MASRASRWRGLLSRLLGEKEKAMTYEELMEHLYEDLDLKQERFDALSPVDRAAWKVISGLTDRKGFDAVWDEIDDEIKDEIFDSIRASIADETGLC
jgi:hypothetical protein